jgi:hypothetical protein
MRDYQDVDRQYVVNKVLPEFKDRFLAWNEEYKHQPRMLGSKGEFANMFRKILKVKSLVWDGVDGSGWRENLRTILFEIIAHAALMLYDLHMESESEDPKAKYPKPRLAAVHMGHGTSEPCGPECPQLFNPVSLP